MGIDKEVVSYKISEMDVVEYMTVDVSKGDFRNRILNIIEAVDILLKESDKILPIIYLNKSKHG
jgi:hypothetical protein